MRLRWLQEIAASLPDGGEPCARCASLCRGMRPRMPMVAQFVGCALYVGMALHPRRAAAASVTPFALSLLSSQDSLVPALGSFPELHLESRWVTYSGRKHTC